MRMWLTLLLIATLLMGGYGFYILTIPVFPAGPPPDLTPLSLKDDDGPVVVIGKVTTRLFLGMFAMGLSEMILIFQLDEQACWKRGGPMVVACAVYRILAHHRSCISCGRSWGTPVKRRSPQSRVP